MRPGDMTNKPIGIPLLRSGAVLVAADGFSLIKNIGRALQVLFGLDMPINFLGSACVCVAEETRYDMKRNGFEHLSSKKVAIRMWPSYRREAGTFRQPLA